MAIPAGFPWSEILLEVISSQRLYHVLRHGLDRYNAVKTPPLELKFHLREWKKMTEGEIRWVERAGDNCHIRKSQKLLHNERRVSRSVVMMLGPGAVVPLLWTIALDVLTSLASELRNRIFHSPPVLAGQILFCTVPSKSYFATFSSSFRSKVFKIALNPWLISVPSWDV